MERHFIDRTVGASILNVGIIDVNQRNSTWKSKNDDLPP